MGDGGFEPITDLVADKENNAPGEQQQLQQLDGKVVEKVLNANANDLAPTAHGKLRALIELKEYGYFWW